MDLGLAFSYVFRDPQWVKKVLIAGLLFFVPIIGWAMILGYGLQIIRNVYMGNDTILPEWTDFGNLLVSGIIVWVGIFIWTLPITIISSIIQFGDSDTSLLFSCLFLPIQLVYQAIFPPIVTARYAVDREFSSMFQFGEVFADIQRAGSALAILFGVTLVAYLVGAAGLIACLIGVVFTLAYAGFVVAHATGQVYRKARGQAVQPQQPAF
jgi:hypothetical protein